ncbi:MAG: response regulator transcription factor [Burkholderiales bacterium]
MRVLIVEDDSKLAGRVKDALTAAGFAADVADNGVDGEHLGEAEPYDAVVLDLGLPRRPGLEVLANWRSRGNDVPVIVLTARDAWHERVDGIKAGADDYLGKPFHIEELLARLNAILRRRHGKANSTIEGGGWVLDEERQCITKPNGATVPLTGMEFRLLRYFMLHPDRILSKSQLSEHVYEYDAERDSNVIEVYVRRLRDKLGVDLIKTRRGQGYVFEVRGQ